MLLAKLSADGKALELQWMWLPTFIGQHHSLLQRMSAEWLSEHPDGMPAYKDAELLVHDWAINWLCRNYKITGLERYLRAIEFVEDSDDSRAARVRDPA